MRRFEVFIAFVLLGTAGARIVPAGVGTYPQAVSSAPPKPYTDRDAYAVYDVVLSAKQSAPNWATTLVVHPVCMPARDVTSWLGNLKIPTEESEKYQPAIADMQSVGQTAWRLESRFRIPQTYVLGAFEPSGLSIGAGHVALSVVGFGRGKTTAIHTAKNTLSPG